MHVSVCVCVCVCMYVYAFMYASLHMCICKQVLSPFHPCSWPEAEQRLHIRMCICIRMYMYMYMSVYFRKTQNDAGGDPGALRGGRTAFLGWRCSVGHVPSYQGSRYDSTTWSGTFGQSTFCMRGALNVVAKAGCREGVHGVSYSLGI